MNYSSAWFEGDMDKPLREAQHAKVRRALNRMVDLKPGERVLEIGCGWGALAEMATTEFQRPHRWRDAEPRTARCLPTSAWRKFGG